MPRGRLSWAAKIFNNVVSAIQAGTMAASHRLHSVQQLFECRQPVIEQRPKSGVQHPPST